MSYAFLGRITRPYADISGVLLDIFKDVGYFWVYQHDADEKVNRTHCHFFTLQSQRDNKTIKNLKVYKELKFKGNSDHAYKNYDSKVDEGNEGEWYNVLKYYSKGTLEPVYCHGARSAQIAEASRLKWEVQEKPQSIKIEVIRERKQLITNSYIAKEAYAKYSEWDVDNKHIFSGTIDMYKLIEIVGGLCKLHNKGRNYRNVANICQDVLADLNPDIWRGKVFALL